MWMLVFLMRVDLINFVNNKIYISVSVTINYGILSKIINTAINISNLQINH